jgi:hypothetical protein
MMGTLFPNHPHSSSEATETTPTPPTRISRLEESSLLALAEAIARKISHDRATIGQDRLLDAVVSQEVSFVFIILQHLNSATQV